MKGVRRLRRVAIWRGGALLVVCAQLSAFSAGAQSKPVATQPVATQPVVSPTSQEARRQAKVLFARAETQYRQGHFAKALANYQAALRFRHHPSIIFNVAQCYRQLKNTERALFFYRLFLADWERIHPGTKAPNEAEVFGRIAKLEALLRAAAARARQPDQSSGELLLTGVPAGAQVLVDGVLRGQGPITAPIAATPGKRLVRVERAGYEPWAQTVTVVAKRRVSAAVHLRLLVNVGIDTHPSAATVFVNGTNRGWTPLRLTLPAERAHALELRKPGYVTVKQSVTLAAKDTAHASYELEPTRDLFGSRNEWFAFEGELAVAKAGFVGGGVALNIVTLKWKYASWTVLTLAAGRGGGGDRGDGLYAHFETRVGYPLRFGRRGQHQLRAGWGFGVAAISVDAATRARQELSWLKTKGTDNGDGDPPFVFLCLSPSIEYLYQTIGRTLFGGGLRVLIPITRDMTNSIEGSPPAIVLFTARIGWASPL